MTDVFSQKKRSLVMAAIRSGGNKDTELKLVGLLRRERLKGWRRNQPLPGKPDFVFRTSKVAVFVDGCFWHCCPRHGRKPDSNQSYWHQKLERNKARAQEVNKVLRREGWQVIRFWEHELAHPEAMIKRLRKALGVWR